MNFPQPNPWGKWKGRGLPAPPPQNFSREVAGFSMPAVPPGAPPFATDDMMRTMVGEQPLSKPQEFDLDARLAALGGPPQRPPLPARPGPDRSAGSVIGQVLAGASDVVGAGAGLRTQNLDKLQALQRNQRDLRYGDQLTQAAADFDNQKRGWDFNLAKIGMQQGADRERYGRGMEGKRFGLAEGGQKFNQDMQTKGFERGGAWRTEDLLRDKERFEYGKTVDTRNFTEGQRRYDEGQLARDFALNSALAKEGREGEVHDLTVPLLKKQMEDATNPKGLGPDLAGQLLTGGEASASISQMKDNAKAEKTRLLQEVMAGRMPKSQADARIKEIDDALQAKIGSHGFDQSDAMKATVYNSMRFLLGDDIAGALVDRPTEGLGGVLQRGFEGSIPGKIRFNPTNPLVPFRAAMPDTK